VWNGLFAPKATPKPVIDRLAAALQAAVKDPTVSQRLEELGAVASKPNEATPAALQALMKSEVARWTPIIKAAAVSAASPCHAHCFRTRLYSSPHLRPLRLRSPRRSRRPTRSSSA